MIALTIAGKQLDLSPDQEIGLVESNPAFDRDFIDRGFSFPFSLPSSARNGAIRRHKNRMDVANGGASTDAKLTFHGAEVFSGKLKQERASETAEEVAFNNATLDFWKKLRTIKINSLLDTIVWKPEGQPEAEWTYQVNPGPATHTIQIDAGTASAVSSDGTIDQQDIVANLIVIQLNALVTGIARIGSGGTIYLNAAVLESNPVTSTSNITLVAHLGAGLQNYQNVIAHVDDVNNTPVDTHCFPVISWSTFYRTKNPMFGNTSPGYVNLWADGDFWPNAKYASTITVDRWENTIVPCVRVPYVLGKIAVAAGYAEFAGEIWEDADIQKLIIPNNYALDKITEEYYDDWVKYKRNTFQTEANLNNHVPDMTAEDFIRDLCTSLCAYVKVEGGKIYLLRKRSQLSGNATDLTTKIERAYEVQRNDGGGWRLDYDRIDTEQLSLPTQLQALEYGNGDIETLVIPSFYFYTGVTLRTYGLAKVPVTIQNGISDVYDQQGRSTLPLALLFFYELQPTNAANDYPFASHDNTNQLGTELGAYSLSITGPFGLYEKWHRGHIELSDADTIVVTVHLTLGALRKITQWRNTRVRFEHPNGAVVGVVKKLEYGLSVRGLGPVRITLLK